MKEYLFKVMARLFAVLDCSTLVTACYGVSYEHFLARTEGAVKDSHGRFRADISVDGIPDGVLLECFDVDGEPNGSHRLLSKVVGLEEGGSVGLTLDKMENID